MARLPQEGGPSRGLPPMRLAILLSLALHYVYAQCLEIQDASAEKETNQGRVPDFHPLRVAEDIESIDGEASSEWLGLNAHLPLLKLSLPSTYMSTLTDVNVQRYAGKVEAQNLEVPDQLRDGIRMLDVRLWKGAKNSGHTTDWFTEVPWRLYEDAQVLRRVRKLPSVISQLRSEAEALDVHSQKDLVESLFKPVLQFLRKSQSEVVVVVFSAVNGNVRTRRNIIEKDSELGEALSSAGPKLEMFLKGGGLYSDNEQDGAVTASTVEARTAWVVPQSSRHSPLVDSFVKKNTTFEDFAEITGMIDKYWGQLLPRHADKFRAPMDREVPMRVSIQQPDAFRQWQRSEGTSLLQRPIRELRDANVVAFVKADHLYDVSYKSESHFAPCAAPHTSLHGTQTDTKKSTWPSCQELCSTKGRLECSSWAWEPDQGEESLGSGGRRLGSDTGSLGHANAGESGTCKLFTSPHEKPHFEAITQQAGCPYADLYSSDLPWNPSEVATDLMRSILPSVQEELPLRLRWRKTNRSNDVISAFDPRVCLLTTGEKSGHETKYGVSRKLIRVVFAPPTPQVRVEAAPGALQPTVSDAVGGFNAMLEKFLLRVFSTSRSLEKEGIRIRVVNAVQVSKYHRVPSSGMQHATTSFFERVMISNPSGSLGPYLVPFPGDFVYFMTDPGFGEAARSLPPSKGSTYATMWMCFLGMLIAISLCIFLSTFWCSCHPGSLLQKICPRHSPAAGAPVASVEVVGTPRSLVSHP